MMRSVVAFAVLLSACSSWAPPKPVPADPAPILPPKGPTSTGRGGTSDAGASEKFAALRDATLDRLEADEPAMGRTLGLHAFDGKVADYSEAGVRAQLVRLHHAADELAAVDARALSDDDALDLALLQNQVALTLFQLEDMASWQKNPRFYEGLFDVESYLDRDYAPLEERAARVLEHEKAALAQAPNVALNLKGPMSKPLLATSAKIFKGYAEYLRGDVVKILKGVGSKEFQADFAKTNEALAKAALAIADLVKKEEKRGDDSYVLGPARYKKLLRVQEGLDLSLADFKKMGEENLAANKAAYLALKKSASFTKPSIDALLPEATKLMDSARAFIESKKLASMPGDERAVTKETPPFMRWNSAFLNPAGPFETKGTTAFYYITKPDPTWKKKDQEEYVAPFGILLSTTVHETYPGHFLQNLWIKRAPTRVQKSLSSYSFVEGWAHYGEQLMIEEGFGDKDPQNKLGQLSDALLRNCRFVVSVALHAEGMTLDQAEKRFRDDCFQDKATAHEQAVRGTFDPGYFAYTLGKIQILALRDEAKAQLGASFSLGRFHDALLGHGSPPVALVRARVLSELRSAK